MNKIELRSAVLLDAVAIGVFHNDVWQASFRELAPIIVQQQLNQAHRVEKWTRALRQPRRDQLVLLAELDGRIVGMGAASAPSSHELGNRGEIYAVYVDPLCQRKGVGWLLMAALARYLKERGYQGAALAVVAGNDPAISFYKSLGGVCVGKATDVGPIWKSDNIILAWDDLTQLTEEHRPVVL